jgi:DNA-binding MarR family transcriptional regulator
MPASRLKLDRFVPYRLSVLANTISRALALGYAERFGLTIPQWRIVAVLGHDPDLSAVEVAKRTVMDKVSVSRAVTALESDGRLIRRVDSSDRRRSLLRLSAAGRAVYREIVPLARSYEMQLLSTLTASERSAFNDLLTRLTQQASALNAPR